MTIANITYLLVEGKKLIWNAFKEPDPEPERQYVNLFYGDIYNTRNLFTSVPQRPVSVQVAMRQVVPEQGQPYYIAWTQYDLQPQYSQQY